MTLDLATIADLAYRLQVLARKDANSPHLPKPKREQLLESAATALRTLEFQRSRFQEALEQYGQHRSGCPVRPTDAIGPEGDGCTCGLTAALHPGDEHGDP